jgi:hypothetical protein
MQDPHPWIKLEAEQKDLITLIVLVIVIVLFTPIVLIILIVLITPHIHLLIMLISMIRETILQPL